MNQSQIIATQTEIGTTPDGFWGPKSIKACQKYLRAMMPSPHPFPKEGSSAFIGFYGPHGVKDGYTPPMTKITLPFTIYYEGSAKTFLRAHEKCAESLLRVFKRLAVEFPDTASRKAAGILTYDGLYNPRLKRGSSSSWSMHSWANAIDIDADRNGNLVSWPVKAVTPLGVMKCFALEGWTSAGAFWGRDAMHHQATEPA